MSIKSDRWIRRMAGEKGMIDPFSPTQVRVNGGEKIVSQGAFGVADSAKVERIGPVKP